jgi:hypothetical protein
LYSLSPVFFPARNVCSLVFVSVNSDGYTDSSHSVGSAVEKMQMFHVLYYSEQAGVCVFHTDVMACIIIGNFISP